jgi:hypothetical protein
MNASPPAPPRTPATAPTPAAGRRRLPWLGGGLLVALIVIGLWPKPLPVETAVATRGRSSSPWTRRA